MSIIKRMLRKLQNLPGWVKVYVDKRNLERDHARLRSIAPLKLCIGVNRSMMDTGWHSLDAAGGADIIDDATKLAKVPDGSCEVIVASHVLEHLNYSAWGKHRVHRTIGILKIWGKKLIPGGKCFIAVPDLDEIVDVLTKYLDRYWMLDDTPYNDIIGGIFGGMYDEYDHHSMLYNYACLRYCMEMAGFTEITRVEDAAGLHPEYNPSVNNLASLRGCLESLFTI